MASSNSTVKNALAAFLEEHNIEDVEGGVDDVVLDYLVSILEDIRESKTNDDDVDVDGFIEMMEAYVPGFAEIDSVLVCDWMFQLTQMKDAKDHRQEQALSVDNSRFQLQGDKCTTDIGTEQSHDDNDNRNIDDDKESTTDPQIEILLEMFPASCSLEVKHCLKLSAGDTDQAVQLILDRQQTGKSIKDKPIQTQDGSLKTTPAKNDKKLKQQMLAKYGYVDEQDDKVVHKPITPKQGPKKMVRYLNGQVVTTKGERFTEIKKPEDPDMKKTYVNLKPARKYRFH